MEPQLPNPLRIPVADADFVWTQLVEEIEDYFQIRREERVKLVDNVISEGWIETYPRIGSTVFNPLQKDSSRGFERWHSTFQTIRRWARIKVIPEGNAYQFDVQIYKELEDLDHPQYSGVASRLQRHDVSPERDRFDIQVSPGSYGWIPVGRDTTLEQRILSRLQARMVDVTPSPIPMRFPDRFQNLRLQQ